MMSLTDYSIGSLKHSLYEEKENVADDAITIDGLSRSLSRADNKKCTLNKTGANMQ
jgi:hypothetical protein